MVDLSALLEQTKQAAIQQLSTTTTVVEGDLPIDLADLRIEAPTWVRYDVTAVVADMVNSTHLGAGGQWEKSTAAIYDAAVSPMVQILDAFGADFIDIQGDGGFGLFTGERQTERAVCAAITVRTFSERGLVKALKAKWPNNTPETGFKLGVAQSRVLAKKVGISRTSHQEPVWAGRAVNHAAKCASAPRRRGSTGSWLPTGSPPRFSATTTCTSRADVRRGPTWSSGRRNRSASSEGRKGACAAALGARNTVPSSSTRSSAARRGARRRGGSARR
jgi:class 3 adenylate cyclase